MSNASSPLGTVTLDFQVSCQRLMSVPTKNNYPPPVIKAWFAMMVYWPINDLLRKWGGLNQILFPVILLSPLLVLVFLWRKKALFIPSSFVLPLLFLLFGTGTTALYYSFSSYGPRFIPVYLLSMSALVAPFLLVCATFKDGNQRSHQSSPHLNLYIVVISAIVLFNNILTIIQSGLSRYDWLNAGAGGEVGQIATNTAIDIRAPGLFTFINGNSTYSVIALIFLLSSFFAASSTRIAASLRLMALLSLPLAIVRSISRTYLFTFLIIIVPFLRYFKRKSFLLSFLVLISLFAFLLILNPNIQTLALDGLENFQSRVEGAGGLQEGLLQRFLDNFIGDGAGNSLFYYIAEWFQHDPFASLLGLGIGSATPLFSYISGNQGATYSFIILSGKSFTIGELGLVTLLSETGVINFIFLIWLSFNFFCEYLRKFPLRIFQLSSSASFSCFTLFLLLAIWNPYYRPFSIFGSSLAVLTSFVCKYLSSIPTQRVSSLQRIMPFSGSMPINGLQS